MSLSSAQLDAFYEVSRCKSFSKAATLLHVTQSALSQRIAHLEQELGATLFIRAPSGLCLTLLGEELQHYCKSRSMLEDECVSRIKNAQSGTMVGVIRIGAYSTVLRSIVLPSLSPFLIAHEDVRLEASSKETRDLPQALRSGEVDFIFLDHRLESEKVETVFLGDEEYVLIESKHVNRDNSVYFDHDVQDQTTLRFFEAQSQRPKVVSRSFLDEIYAIIDGVALGLGRAVVPLHLVKNDKRIRRVKELKPLRIPVYFIYNRQSVYTRLQKAVIALLEREPKAFLSPNMVL